MKKWHLLTNTEHNLHSGLTNAVSAIGGWRGGVRQTVLAETPKKQRWWEQPAVSSHPLCLHLRGHDLEVQQSSVLPGL